MKAMLTMLMPIGIVTRHASRVVGAKIFCFFGGRHLFFGQLESELCSEKAAGAKGYPLTAELITVDFSRTRKESKEIMSDNHNQQRTVSTRIAWLSPVLRIPENGEERSRTCARERSRMEQSLGRERPLPFLSQLTVQLRNQSAAGTGGNSAQQQGCANAAIMTELNQTFAAYRQQIPPGCCGSPRSGGSAALYLDSPSRRGRPPYPASQRIVRRLRILRPLEEVSKLLLGEYPGGTKNGDLNVEEEDANKSPSVETERPSSSRTSLTLSVAVPGSILNNAQSLELRTYLAGQIARCCGIFRADEVVVFDEYARLTKKEIEAYQSGEELNNLDRPNCNLHLARLLQYVECPQYLRKHLFPMSRDLRFAGLLNPLDSPHHMRIDDLTLPYREAVTLSKPTKEDRGSFCNAGLTKEVRISENLQPGLRITVKLDTFDLGKKCLKGRVVSPCSPVEEMGLYWGYNVRLARSLSGVFAESPFPGGYDCTVGTSEKGALVDNAKFPSPKHILIVFGGLKGLESCVENDEELDVGDASVLFDHYLNTCPSQGSRTIRTEEAILISLSAIRMKLEEKQ